MLRNPEKNPEKNFQYMFHTKYGLMLLLLIDGAPSVNQFFHPCMQIPVVEARQEA